ncbi:MAG: CRISPR-associated endonuclease Cas3'' [Oleiphilus sp.]|nr:MAG: CRISPR-associated endonuclease Cas3'' [Oleiphilus sp.]
MVKFIAHKRKLDDQCQSLETHLVETGLLAKAFASKFGLAELGELLGLLHDFGKYSEEFQNCLTSAKGDFEVGDERDMGAEPLDGNVNILLEQIYLHNFFELHLVILGYEFGRVIKWPQP